MLKRTDNAGSWAIIDNKRTPTNPRNLELFANLNDADNTFTAVDFLSNGFQIINTSNTYNANGDTFIYMAFAADPDTEAPTLASSFNIETYTGTSATQSISGLGFSPNLIWLKERSGTDRHVLIDTIRGANSQLSSNDSNAETTYSSNLESFDTNGFTLGSATETNGSGETYVGWTWKADDNEPTIYGGPAKAVYKFEDNANDVTGNNNATANSITYATGKFNKAAVFNGSSGDIDLPADIESSTMAVSLWAYLDDNAPTNQIIIEFDNGYGLNFPSFASGKLAAQWANSNANHTLSNSTLSNGQWYHIAANFRSGATDLYINGVKQTTGGTASDYLTADQNTIGSRRSGEFFDGMIDQVRIYNGNFQQIQVDELYAETVSDNDDLELGGPPEILISANANAGFSIVKFTNSSPGSNARILHGLSATPNMIIVKRTDGTENWYVYHSSMGTSKFMRLDLTDAQGTATNLFNTVNSTVFNPSFTNTAGQTCIAYCFHDISNYQKFGSYTGNGSSTGPSVTLGFRADWILIKRYDAVEDWKVIDSVRGFANTLEPNSSGAEETGNNSNFTITSTGFQIGDTHGDFNANNGTYIYWAVAKNVPSNTTLANSFKAVTYTGNGGTQSITGVGFRPDLIWVKRRDGTGNHYLQDTLRGLRSQISSNLSAAATTYSSNITSYDTDGFTLGTSTDNNGNGQTFVAWTWKAGNTWQSNVDGTIPSITNTNTANGFSIVKYTGTGSVATIGHGLSAAPTFIIVKALVATANSNWTVYHSSVGNTKALKLSTNAAEDDQDGYWNDTSPTATLFTVKDYAVVNESAKEYIAYCFHDVTGYSKFGTYSGTGSSQTITTGFTPDFVITKKTNGTDNWRMYDSVRQNAQPFDEVMYPNLSDGEDDNTNGISGTTATGFTLGTGNLSNNSGDTYIYIAFKMN